ncbi:MAG: Ltp family lipoprotein [Lentilactobacillus buchneri]|nr:Ltp family lipoprotein [Lentilactobacillus buchneri]
MLKSLKKSLVGVTVGLSLGLGMFEASQFQGQPSQLVVHASSRSAALHSAYFYARSEHMSKRAIYHQLISKYGDGFSKHSASYAVRHLHGISWNRNALKSARFYRHSEHMSNYAIYHQLISSYGDMFTKSQAHYAVRHL